MKPISFTRENYAAFVRGNKTQTRRVIVPQPVEYDGMWMWKKIAWGAVTEPADPTKHCPYGRPGDTLWIQEPFQVIGCDDEMEEITVRYLWPNPKHERDSYSCPLTDHEWCLFNNRSKPLAKTSGRFMYHSLTREFATVKEVRAERVQDISEADAKAEGATFGQWSGGDVLYEPTDDADIRASSYRQGFGFLWDAINSKRGYSWDSNPWVWVLTLERMKP